MSKRANEYSAKISGADTAWYHCDALGSPRKMSNETGHACWQSRYYPFGEMFTQVGSGNSHTFTGKELDSETGLNYFCQRYYDPEMGRFMELDPQDSPASSPYAYCVNNPLAFTDPTGEKNVREELEWALSDFSQRHFSNAGPNFASWPGSMNSFMMANPWFEAMVRQNEYISQQRFYYAQHNYFRRTYQYGTTTIETYVYFNPITMTAMIGMNRFDNADRMAGQGAGESSTYGPGEEMFMMRVVYQEFCIASYQVYGSTAVLTDVGRMLGGDNVWACADWSYAVNDMFQGMNLRWWHTDVYNLKFHSIVRARWYGGIALFDPWIEAPILYGLNQWLHP